MIVELMGGTIVLDSVENEGTVVTVELAAATAIVPDHEKLPTDGESRYVLGVEDNEASALLLQRVVEREPGLLFVGSSTVAGALEILRRRVPSMVLLDLHLADGSGEDVLAAMRSDPTLRPVPVVVVTADADPAAMRRAVAAGAVDFLPKPVSVAQLRDVIRRLTCVVP